MFVPQDTMARPYNILLSSFPGLSLPETTSLSVPSTATTAELIEEITSHLPSSPHASRLTLTTTNNKEVIPSSEPTSILVPRGEFLLPLRLSAPLCGGKGGFGSQLRAAGGRMSSKRKGQQGENNGSNRNLDGRRLRTVNEAKALAEYLALKPDMNNKEKEARRKRWEMVVEAAERREEELRRGEGKGKVDGAWMEDKEEIGERARDAVARAMKDGTWKDRLAGSPHNTVIAESNSNDASGGSASPSDEDSDMEDAEADLVSPIPKAKKVFGFDEEDDEDILSDEEEVEDMGKGKAVAS